MPSNASFMIIIQMSAIIGVSVFSIHAATFTWSMYDRDNTMLMLVLVHQKHCGNADVFHSCRISCDIHLPGVSKVGNHGIAHWGISDAVVEDRYPDLSQ